MAARIWQGIQGLVHGHKIIVGSFRPNGSSALVSSQVTGRGFSVARTSTGLYTVTFVDPYPQLVGFSFSARVSDATPVIVQGGAWSAANKTLVIRVLKETTGTLAVADLASDADNVISFVAHFRNSNINVTG